MISNTSRDQRKGRVGRISDGTVYYLYDKSKPNNIKTRYNISYEDFTNEFIKLFDNVESTEKKNYYNEYFFHRAIDNNFSKFINTDPRIKNNIVSASVNNNEFSIINEFENSIQRIIFYQFYTDDNTNNMETFMSEETLFMYAPSQFFNTETSPHFIIDHSLSGFLYEKLLDLYGKLFIAHPYEKDYKRNIFLEFISYKNKILNKKAITMLNEYFVCFKKHLRLVTINYNFENDFEILAKTRLSRIIENVTRIFPTSFDYSKASILLYSNACGLLTEVTMLISLLENIGYSIENLFIDKESSIQNRLYFTNKSDLEPLLKICINFKSYFKEKIIFNFETEIDKLYITYERICEKMISNSGYIKIPKNKKIYFDNIKITTTTNTILKNIQNIH